MSLPKRLPFALSERIAAATAAAYDPQGREFDLAIGGIPFIVATTDQMPYSIETIKVQKNQVDTEDAGEQSLSGWWRRAQASFHEGAGNLYQEIATTGYRTLPTNGFRASAGMDVFTQGQATLLKRMKASAVAAALHTHVRSYFAASGPQGFSAIGDGALHTAAAATGTFAVLHAPATKVIADGLVSAASFYDVATDGTLYEGTVASPGTATSWPCGDVCSRMGWGKYRLWVIGGRKIWQPDLSLAGGTAQNPVFTNPNKGWTYTCMAEGTSAMYFGGHDGFASSIQAVQFTSGGGLPALSGAAVTAALPDGELVQEIATLAGQFVGIGTSRGFRVGVIQSDASITYGPLLVEPTGITKCTALAAQGRFFVVAFATASGDAVAYRIDTGTQLSENGVFPYASDISLEFVGSITSLTAASTTQLLATGSNGGVYYQSPTEFVPTGYMESGRIRYRTTDPKVFKYLSMGIAPLAGTIAVSVATDAHSGLALGTVGVQGEIFTDQFEIREAPSEYMSVRFDFARSASGLAAPILQSFLVKAAPAVTPQRMITVPLLCFDSEQARSGQRYGATGYAMDRLRALSLLEDVADILTFQDFSGGIGDHRVIIESLKFVQTAPSKGTSGAGGVLLAELRTVEA